MKKYSIKWKLLQVAKRNGWAQYHSDVGVWKWHYITCDTERSYGSYFSEKACIEDNTQ